jgi:class 3 adenylate cyclase
MTAAELPGRADWPWAPGGGGDDPSDPGRRVLEPPGPPVSEPAPREELRPVTVLFAEVSALGGSAMPDPEAVREIVGSSLAAVIAEVEALGGRVTSVSGRGLQALWGAPRAHEDDPERSMRAAYRCLAAVAALPAPAPALRIGVESGPAVVGPIGGGEKVEYGALGDVVAVAASLQSLARPGSALVGPATRAAAGHLFSWAASPGPGAPPVRGQLQRSWAALVTAAAATWATRESKASCSTSATKLGLHGAGGAGGAVDTARAVARSPRVPLEPGRDCVRA